MSVVNLREKAGQVGIEGSGPPEDFGVAHPAQTFVALRAIRGHTQKVSALPPENVAPQLVHHLVSGAELNGEGRVGVEDDAFDRILRRSSRIAA